MLRIKTTSHAGGTQGGIKRNAQYLDVHPVIGVLNKDQHGFRMDITKICRPDFVLISHSVESYAGSLGQRMHVSSSRPSFIHTAILDAYYPGPHNLKTPF